MARFWTPFLAIFDDFDPFYQLNACDYRAISDFRMIVPKFERRNLLPPFARKCAGYFLSNPPGSVTKNFKNIKK